MKYNFDASKFEKQKRNFAKWEKIGDSYVGVYVEREVRTNTLRQPNCLQAVYHLITPEGEDLYISGRSSKQPDGVQVIGGLEKAEIGRAVRVVYTKDLPSKRAGYQAAKIIDTEDGEFMPDVLADFQAKKAAADFGGKVVEPVDVESIPM
jgi:hypothetical protein